MNSQAAENPSGETLNADQTNTGKASQNNKKFRSIFKKTGNHLFEFFMLFLAVFCGFMAENLREQLSENQREKIFIKSILEDIKSDTLESNAILTRLNTRRTGIDSVMTELQSPHVMKNSNNLYRLWTASLGLDVFISNDRTIQQLKSSGELRLIRNKKVSDSIMQYDQVVKKYYTQSNLMYNALTNMTAYSQLFDFIALNNERNFPVPLATQKKEMLNQAYGHLNLWHRGLDGLIGWLEVVNKEAKDLLAIIKKEYDLD